VQLGLEVFLNKPPRELLNKRWGLLSNQASIDRSGHYSKDLLRRKFENNLTCLFSPQHGFWGTEQDNMVETPDDRDSATGLPIFSLYSHTRRLTAEMLAGIDLLLVDLQDVGTRVYTFITTLAYVLQEAKKFGKGVVVLDRPNPLGGEAVEGNVLRTDLISFVGAWKLPMRHGLTLGELAGLFNQVLGIGADLSVVAMEGWTRDRFFDQIARFWVSPSPNMPSLGTAVVYPGQVLWEGTNVSEGRGTTRPFETFGAPFIEPSRVKKRLEEFPIPGANLLETAFRPAFHKWQGEVCRGFFLQVYDRRAFQPYRATLNLLQVIRDLYPHDFRWKEPPYEYENERMPIDLLIGDQSLRQELEDGQPVSDLEAAWKPGLEDFLRLREAFLLY
jgi:uncharacterized protein YbbC (DUF1343 family)